MALRSAKKEIIPRAYIQCAHDLCPHSAILRLKLPTGWAVLCRQHYEFHIQREADAFCLENELHTIEQKRAWCREKMKQFGRFDLHDHWTKVLSTPGLTPYAYECARSVLKS